MKYFLNRDFLYSVNNELYVSVLNYKYVEDALVENSTVDKSLPLEVIFTHLTNFILTGIINLTIMSRKGSQSYGNLSSWEIIINICKRLKESKRYNTKRKVNDRTGKLYLKKFS